MAGLFHYLMWTPSKKRKEDAEQSRTERKKLKRKEDAEQSRTERKKLKRKEDAEQSRTERKKLKRNEDAEHRRTERNKLKRKEDAEQSRTERNKRARGETTALVKNAKQRPPQDKPTCDGTMALVKNQKEWDARKDMGLSINVKDQGDSEFCWSFVAVTVVEYALQIYRGIDVRLSIQQVVDNVVWKRGHNNSYEHAFDYMMKHRVTLARHYPFTRRAQQPRLLSPLEKKEAYKIKDFKNLNASNEKRLMRILRKRGPVALGLCVDAGFDYLKDGIYPGLKRPFKRHEHSRCADVSDHSDESHDSESCFGSNNGKDVHNLHAVVLVGFGTDDTKGESINYWIIQSSDGFQWGVGGICRIRRDSSIRARYHSPMLQCAIPIL